MKLSDIRELVHVGSPEAPYGVRALACCYDIDDLARLARKRLPAGAAGSLSSPCARPAVPFTSESKTAALNLKSSHMSSCSSSRPPVGRCTSSVP
jgi:hypothetical protein